MLYSSHAEDIYNDTFFSSSILNLLLKYGYESTI